MRTLRTLYIFKNYTYLQMNLAQLAALKKKSVMIIIVMIYYYLKKTKYETKPKMPNHPDVCQYKLVSGCRNDRDFSVLWLMVSRECDESGETAAQVS